MVLAFMQLIRLINNQKYTVLWELYSLSLTFFIIPITLSIARVLQIKQI